MVTNESGCTSITLFYQITRMTIKDFYFHTQKLGSVQEDLIAVRRIADIYDKNHSENAEAQGGPRFTFTLFEWGEKGEEQETKTTKPNLCNFSDCCISWDALSLSWMKRWKKEASLAIFWKLLFYPLGATEYFHKLMSMNPLYLENIYVSSFKDVTLSRGNYLLV